ncbi:MAG: site-specific tyrosine recombinase/integron integrase [Candidatus Kariarchaeaceae archaeon]|jgi:site-specific recombinase XerD
MTEQDMEVSFFLDYLKIERGCSENTIKGYSHDLLTLKDFLNRKGWGINEQQKIDWNKVNILHLRGFLAHLYNEKDNKTSSIHRRVCSCKAFFKYMKANKLVQEDPAEELKYPKRPASLPKFLEARDILAIISKTKNLLHRSIIEVLYSTGARCNEMRSMDMDDINLVEKNIIIRSGKGGKDRIVLLSQRAADILTNYITDMRPRLLEKAASKGKLDMDAQSALFLSNRGSRIANRTIQHFISKLSEEAGVKHTTPHMLRHSFASHLVMSKTNIRVVQQLLGHSSLDTTQIYANVTPEYLKDQFDGSLPIR